MPVRGGGDEIRAQEFRAEPRDLPPNYRRSRKEPSSQSFEQEPTYPQDARGYGRASEPYTAYKVSGKYRIVLILFCEGNIYILSLYPNTSRQSRLNNVDVRFKMSICKPKARIFVFIARLVDFKRKLKYSA